MKELHPVRIRIQQFQSIEDLEIEVRGFTCITGPTNIGKSAILRAVAASILGDSVIGMVRKGSSFCTVEASSEGWGFKWEKGERGVNRYVIDGITYDKVGQKQIPEIEKMGFGSVSIGSKELQPWFASQFTPLFLLNETGPAVTDFISKVSNLTAIQDAVVLASRGKKRAADIAKDYESTTQEHKEKLSKVSGLHGLETLEKELTEQYASVQEYETRIAKGENILERIADSTRRLNSLGEIDNVKVPVVDVELDIQKYAKMYRAWQKLETAAKGVIALKALKVIDIPNLPTTDLERLKLAVNLSRTSKLRESLDILEPIQKVSIPEDIVRSSIDRYKNVVTAQNKIVRAGQSVIRLKSLPEIPSMPEITVVVKAAALAKKIVKIKTEIAELDERLADKSRELEVIDGQISEIPKCPSCGRAAAGNHKHRVAHHA